MAFYIISEVTSHEYKILSESKTNGVWKLRLEAVLQTADEVNANRRVYPRDVLKEAIEALRPRAAKRMLLGELDHPISDDMQRQVTVLYKESSHLICDVWLDGKYVRSVCETLDTPNGRILTSLLKDNIPVGFSVRAVGKVEMKDGVAVVTKPLTIITYDAVSNPSHTNATVISVKESQYPTLREWLALPIGEEVDVETLIEEFLVSAVDVQHVTPTQTQTLRKQKLGVWYHVLKSKLLEG